MPILVRPTAEISFEVFGDSGPWLTLVNGHTRGKKDFRLLSKNLVAAGYRCLTFDNRGAGDSTESDPFSFAEMVDDVLALWQHLHIERSALLGISMGGEIAQTLAAQDPHRLSALILVSTTASLHWFHSPTANGWGGDLASIENKLAKHVAAEFRAKNALLLRAMAKNILDELPKGFDQRATLQRNAISTFDGRDQLRRITAPTLVMHGEDDEIILVGAARELQTAIQGAELSILPLTGHLLLAERPKVLTKAVVEFLARHPSGPAPAVS